MLCRLENLENGRTKFISLPKSERRIASYLVDIGVTVDTDMEFRISYIGTKRPELGKQMMELGLSLEELNLVANYMFDKTEYWEECFEWLLKVINPKNPKDFINLMYQSMAYHFFDATNDEELGKYIKKTVAQQDEFIKGFVKGCKGRSDEELGRLFRMYSKGEYTPIGKYIIMRKLSEEEKEGPPYDGINTNREWYEMDDDPYCMCEVEVSDEKDVIAYKEKKADTIPFLKLKFPMTMNEIVHSLKKIKSDTIFTSVTDEEVMFPTENTKDMSLWKINELAEIWEDLYQQNSQIEKLWAIMTYEKRAITFEDIVECVMNMHNYRYYPGAQEKHDISSCNQIKKRYPNNDPTRERHCSKMEIVVELMREFGGRILKDFGILLHTNGEKGFEEYYEVECV